MGKFYNNVLSVWEPDCRKLPSIGQDTAGWLTIWCREVGYYRQN